MSISKELKRESQVKYLERQEPDTSCHFELERVEQDIFPFSGTTSSFKQNNFNETREFLQEVGHEVCETVYEDNFELLTRQLKGHYEERFGSNYQLAICDFLHSNVTAKNLDITEIGYGHLSQIWYQECEPQLLEMLEPQSPPPYASPMRQAA